MYFGTFMIARVNEGIGDPNFLLLLLIVYLPHSVALFTSFLPHPAFNEKTLHEHLQKIHILLILIGKVMPHSFWLLHCLAAE